MSWLELDDRILEHPKFVRAVKLGGSEAIHMWLGLRAFCGQLLTDGAIPLDMVDEVRGPKHPVKRSSAISVLVEVGLVDRTKDGLQLHDYLDWSMSREQVLARRDSAARRKRRERGTDTVVTEESRRDGRVTDSDVTNPRARVSSPLPSSPLPSGGRSERPQDPDPEPALWSAYMWLAKFKAAWDMKYSGSFYGQAGDEKACGTLQDLLRKLPEEQRLKAQSRVDLMLGQFLAGDNETIRTRKHPFAFFVGDFGSLRVGGAVPANRDPVLDAAVAKTGSRPYLPPDKGAAHGA